MSNEESDRFSYDVIVQSEKSEGAGIPHPMLFCAERCLLAQSSFRSAVFGPVAKSNNFLRNWKRLLFYFLRERLEQRVWTKRRTGIRLIDTQFPRLSRPDVSKTNFESITHFIWEIEICKYRYSRHWWSIVVWRDDSFKMVSRYEFQMFFCIKLKLLCGILTCGN